MPDVLKKQTIFFFGLIALITGLFAALYLTKQSQDIRPKALQGNANLNLNADTSSPAVNGYFNVLASVYLTDSTLRISGADFTILYDKSRLEAVSVVPETGTNSAFTDAPIVSMEGSYDATYNFLRVSEIAVKPDIQLKGGSVNLANIRFRAKASGNAVIKYIDDNSKLELVGINVQ